jgi:hypothetical protein
MLPALDFLFAAAAVGELQFIFDIGRIYRNCRQSAGMQHIILGLYYIIDPKDDLSPLSPLQPCLTEVDSIF